jgi:23S rRNA (cytosine1962-C5)-methyltransferase
VESAAGEWLARGYFNPKSQIVVRLLSWEVGEPLDGVFWRERLTRAVRLRKALQVDQQSDAYRMVFAESDGLPGLIVDRFSDWLVVQVLTLGMELRRAEIVDCLVDLFSPRGILDRSDASVRLLEGLRRQSGQLWGAPPPAEFAIREGRFTIPVSLQSGQKTGFYLDQRENRLRIGAFAEGRRVLNVFSFTGAFGIHALGCGATHVTNIDSSQDALVTGEQALRMNGFDPDRQADALLGDAFQILRALRDEGRQYDLVILDPPKFVQRKSDLPAATRGYKDINLLGMSLLAPGGYLATFSCSGLLSPDLFQKILFGASLDAGRDAQIVQRLSQACDHPVLLSFPESEYLKGLLCWCA